MALSSFIVVVDGVADWVCLLLSGLDLADLCSILLVLLLSQLVLETESLLLSKFVGEELMQSLFLVGECASLDEQVC